MNGASTATRAGPGATANPARRIEYCHTSVRNRIDEKNMAVKPMPNHSDAALPHEKLLIENNSRSSTGAGVDRWCTMKMPSSPTPAAIEPSVAALAQPHSSLWTTPSDTRPAARAISTTPRGVGNTAASLRDSFRTRRPVTTVKMPIGRLRKKTQRQLAASTRTAPSVGPSAPATAPVAPQMATATGTLAGGNARRTRASDEGIRTAAPAAWTTRSPMRTPAVGASPHGIDAIVKSTDPLRKARLWPIRSASFPTGYEERSEHDRVQR